MMACADHRCESLTDLASTKEAADCARCSAAAARRGALERLRAALRDCAFLFDASRPRPRQRGRGSKRAARRRRGDQRTYGEIDPVGFLALLDALPLARGSVFVDLGCGLGKAAILAAAARPDAFRTAHGIEIAEPLHRASLELLAATRARLGAQVADRVTLVCGDIRDSACWPDDRADGTIVAFLYWSTWPEELRCAVARRVVAETAPGALVVVSRFSLPFPEVDCFKTRRAALGRLRGVVSETGRVAGGVVISSREITKRNEIIIYDAALQRTSPPAPPRRQNL